MQRHGGRGWGKAGQGSGSARQGQGRGKEGARKGQGYARAGQPMQVMRLTAAGHGGCRRGSGTTLWVAAWLSGRRRGGHRCQHRRRERGRGIGIACRRRCGSCGIACRRGRGSVGIACRRRRGSGGVACRRRSGSGGVACRRGRGSVGIACRHRRGSGGITCSAGNTAAAIQAEHLLSVMSKRVCSWRGTLRSHARGPATAANVRRGTLPLAANPWAVGEGCQQVAGRVAGGWRGVARGVEA